MKRMDRVKIKQFESAITNSYKNGLAAKKIIERYPIGNTTLFRILKRNGIETKLSINQYKNDAVLKKYCKNCNKIILKKSRESWKQFSQKKFCSRKCFSLANTGIKTGRVPRSAFQKGNIPFNKGKNHLAGEKNPNWKPKVIRYCKTCGKKIELHPYRVKNVKANYCSTRCSVLSQEMPQHNTVPERIFKKLLINMGLSEGKDFTHQFIFNNKFKCDFAFPDKKIIIEIFGDYYHANPLEHSYNPETFVMANGKKLSPYRQIKNIKNDKAKQAYITKCGWKFLFFWASDLEKNEKNVIETVKQSLGTNKKETVDES